MRRDAPATCDIESEAMTSSNAVWTEPIKADDVRREAIALATFAVTSPDLRELTRKEVLAKYVLVLLTHGTSNGKYGTRYRSREALSVTDPTELNHEHVFPRKWLIEQMIAEPSNIEMLLTQFAIACTVTEKEHKRLALAEKANADLVGWERYNAADIVVTDMATGEIVPQSVGLVPDPPHKRAEF